MLVYSCSLIEFKIDAASLCVILFILKTFLQ